MNREILFRGKRFDNGEWVYGSLVQMPVDGRIATFICPVKEVGRGNKDVPPMGILYTLNKDIFMVDPTTVGQFTGLYDKNGKEIYEGDIVKMSTAMYGDEIFRVGYEDSHIGAFCLCSSDAEDTSRFVGIFGRDYGYEPFYCEVIGNVYDNFNLLQL